MSLESQPRSFRAFVTAHRIVFEVHEQLFEQRTHAVRSFWHAFAACECQPGVDAHARSARGLHEFDPGALRDGQESL